jgi:hypothetical protein
MLLSSIKHNPFPITSIYTLQVRSISDDATFEVNGTRYTRSEVLAVAPEERSLEQWLILVDWTQVRSRPYVIVDPFDPAGLMYLNYAEYLVQTRTLASASVSLTVIYRPGVVKPTLLPKVPPHPKSKTSWMHGDRTFGIPVATIPFKSLDNLKRWLSRNFTWSRDGTVKVNDRNVRGFLTLWSREAGHLLGLGSSVGREVAINPLITHLERAFIQESPAQVIKRMKISVFVILSYIAGNKLKDTEALGKRIRLCNGLPKALGLRARCHIRRGSPQAIRFWTSLLTAYKAMDGGVPPTPDLTTITAQPNVDVPIGEFSEFCNSTEGFWSLWEEAHALNYKDGRLPVFKYRSSYGKAITSGGANSSIAISGAQADAYAWATAPRNYARELLQLFGDSSLIHLMDMMASGYHEQGVTGDPSSVPYRAQVMTFIQNNFWNTLNLFELFLRPSRCTESPQFTLEGILKGLTPRNDQWGNRLPKMGVRKDPAIEANLLADILSGDFFGSYRRYVTRTPLTHTQWHSKKLHLPAYLRFPHKAGMAILGRLHAIYEAAGKVRIVAICDYFTQLVCEPIHKYIFALLKGNAQDGTFDQEGAVRSFAEKGYREIYSFDLKSATDLIPLELYLEVLTPLFGRKITELWSRLLTDRWFLAPHESQDELRRFSESPESFRTPPVGSRIRKVGPAYYVKYTRGQPMGALSSWGSMALVHHAMVQFAARPYFDVWFVAYRVLGDDIVIADARVAAAYVDLCKRYGIALSLAKSLVSKDGVFNFASQTFRKEDNLSTISLKEAIAASTWPARTALALRVLSRTGRKVTYGNLLRLVSTFPLWNYISAELSHGMKSGSHRFVEFILHNPFLGSRPWEVPYIDSLISWLGIINPKFNTLSLVQTALFEKEIRERVIKMILDRVNEDARSVKLALQAIERDRILLILRDNTSSTVQSLYLLEVLETKLTRVSTALSLVREEFVNSEDTDQIATHNILKRYVEICSICTLPATWNKDLSTGDKAPWANILKGMGEAELAQELKDTTDRIALFKAKGIYLRNLPKDKFTTLPLVALFEATLEATSTISPFPVPLRSLPKGFSGRLYSRFLELRRIAARDSARLMAPSAVGMSLVPYTRVHYMFKWN